jgi:hypothetical protein
VGHPAQIKSKFVKRQKAKAIAAEVLASHSSLRDEWGTLGSGSLEMGQRPMCGAPGNTLVDGFEILLGVRPRRGRQHNCDY